LQWFLPIPYGHLARKAMSRSDILRLIFSFDVVRQRVRRGPSAGQIFIRIRGLTYKVTLPKQRFYHNYDIFAVLDMAVHYPAGDFKSV
jgi:hypothetical protein